MDLTGFLHASLGAPDHADKIASLGAECRRREEELAALKREHARLERVAWAINELAHCQRAPVFSSKRDRRFFVTRYAAVPDPRARTARLTSVECVIVPEAVVGQDLHRPRPHEDPAQAARGVVTMTSTPVPGDEIAREIASSYASGVRLGAYTDALTEPCAACGKKALVVCCHSWDYDSGYQWMSVDRLCPHCPLLAEIAAESWGDDEPSTILPPKDPPRRRY